LSAKTLKRWWRNRIGLLLQGGNGTAFCCITGFGKSNLGGKIKMANLVLVIGESGAGKTTSMRTLDAQKTFLTAPLNKPLPFKGWKTKYIPMSKENGAGNYLITEDHESIIKTVDYVSEKRKEINAIVLDDFQYVTANYFMRNHSLPENKGNAVFQLYNNIADRVWKIIIAAQFARQDLTIFFLSHSETTETGKTKIKTIGRLLDEKITLEGMFTVVLESKVVDGKFVFLTQNNGFNTAKAPIGMFSSLQIENDLELVRKAIVEYNQ